ncbi:serine/threonine-protein phosphatase 6 regulatory subunit 3-like isoform X1 [Saccostrea echinata]|uniref:serine/threonine-protein phosphatase 6 regulatory subunit 3-like isoform X1 n=1 Tax=Saccostrea echinata TaxID=191078 RepID=UPI002A833A3F|nr:serine/threonine-protein phosphatase 6 regulatory subunit 3-like isoform X1 [Saccostrea echinata]XP_061176458.1 serine/threonine-protein phosphatase 6 regulatory subunit 3-like isoform X1 [Saccostrea echinata]
MFWKFNLITTSHIDTILEKEDVTLQELMDEEDILQECKSQNTKLIEFITKPENMEEMVKLITVEPTDSDDEKLRYKYPNTACELLTSDVSQVNDALADSEELVKKLYAFLEMEKPLNPLLASFFSKVMGLLITRKSEMIFNFLKSQEDFVGTLLDHIGTSAIMDLLLRLLTCVEWVELRKAVIEWLNEKQIVERLIGCIVPTQDEDVHCNAAQSLCDIVRLGREQLSQLQDRTETDPLLNTVEQEDNVADLLTNMLDTGKNESVIVNGLSVIQTLLEFRKQGPEGSTDQITSLDTDRLAQGVTNVLLAITPRLKDFHSLLVEPPKQRFETMPTTVGNLDPPLGNTRLQTVRLIAAVVLTNTHTVNVELANLGTTKVLLDLCFHYTWNNFLHTHVSQCVNTILYNSPVEVDGKKEHPLLVQLFSDCNILQRIMDIWEENDQQQSQERGMRRGYMGHLTKMANDIVAVMEKGENSDLVKDSIAELPEEVRERWDNFVAGALSDVNKRNTVESMRGRPLTSSSDDEESDFRDIPFPQDAAMQQAFSDYQLQQMTSNFIDQFGFNEEEFQEQEEKADSPFGDRISSIDFTVQAGDENSAAASMFEQACNERIQQFDDNDSDEDIWEEKEITFSPNAQQPNRATRLPETRDDSDSTDSEEELDSPRKIVSQPNEKMDVDNSENWANFDDVATESVPVAMDTSSWSQTSTSAEASSSSEKSEKWADFSNKFPREETRDNWADFSNIRDLSATDPGPRSSSPVAMDTNEVNSRPAAYLARSAPADLAVELNSEELRTEDLTEKDSMVQEEEVSSTSDDATLPPQTPRLSNSSPKQQASSVEPEEPSSSTPAIPATPPVVSSPSSQYTPPTRPSGSEDEGSSVDAAPSSSVDRAPASAPEVSCSSSDSSVDGQEDRIEDSLSANFDFLTNAGLMKSPVHLQGSGDKAVEANGPIPESSNIKENPSSETLAQAKDSPEKSDTVLSSSSPTLQNGPV